MPVIYTPMPVEFNWNRLDWIHSEYNVVTVSNDKHSEIPLQMLPNVICIYPSKHI